MHIRNCNQTGYYTASGIFKQADDIQEDSMITTMELYRGALKLCSNL